MPPQILVSVAGARLVAKFKRQMVCQFADVAWPVGQQVQLGSERTRKDDRQRTRKDDRQMSCVQLLAMDFTRDV